MELTRRVFLGGAGSLAASLALAACDGGAEDSASGGNGQGATEQADVATAAPDVTPPDEREFWVCVAGTSHRDETNVDDETGEENSFVIDKQWTATLDDHGNVISVNGGEASATQHEISFELNEDGFMTHSEDSVPGSPVYDVAYEYDYEGRPVTCEVTGVDDERINYTLTVTYNDLGDIKKIAYEDHGANDGLKWSNEFDALGVEASYVGERNDEGLPTHSSTPVLNGARGDATEESTYEYDDNGNLIHCSYVFTDTVDSEVVIDRKMEYDFEYQQVEDPSLAVRLGSHLWGCRSSFTDLLPWQPYMQASEKDVTWYL